MDSLNIGIFSPYHTNGGGMEVQNIFCEMLGLASKSSNINFIKLEKFNLFKLMKIIFFDYFDDSFLIDYEKYDFLIIQGLFSINGIILRNFSAKKNIPFIVIPRGDFVPTINCIFKTRHFFFKLIIWYLLSLPSLKMANSIIFTSSLEYRRLKDVGLSGIKTFVIPDPFFWVDDKAPLFCKDNEYTQSILYLGRISHEKNLFFLINIWPEILLRNSNARLIIAGSIYHEDIYRKLIKLISNSESLTHSVTLLPWVSGEEKLKLISDSRCLVLPSYNESFGLTVLEAISQGTPVLVSSGTPWRKLPNYIGLCLPLKREEWIKAICDYLIVADKQIIPKDVRSEFLFSFSPINVALKWKRVFGYLLIKK